MAHDATAFRIVGRLPRRRYCPCLVYRATQTAKCVKSGYLVGVGRRYRIFFWKFYAGSWNGFFVALQLLEYYGVFHRLFWRTGNGVWNAQLVLARQRPRPW